MRVGGRGKTFTRKSMNYSLSCSLLGFVLLQAMPVYATVIHSYDFDSSLADTLGRGPDLNAFGGRLRGGRYNFDVNQGLSLRSALASPRSYSIEIKFEASSSFTSSWHKLIDFANLTDDTGFYFFGPPSSGPFGIQFFPNALNGADEFLLNTDVILRLNRNGITNEVEGFLNNVSQWKFIDSFDNAVPENNLLTFFTDDTSTSQREGFFGSVDYIRILDNSTVVPEPSSFIIWSLLGFGSRSWLGRCRTFRKATLAMR